MNAIYELIQWHEHQWKECEREQGQEDSARFHRDAVAVLANLILPLELTTKGEEAGLF